MSVPSVSAFNKYILVLPCEGSPYIWKNKIFNTKDKSGKNELIEEMTKVVRGSPEEIYNQTEQLRIHPLFTDRWTVARDVLKDKTTKVYCNENGAYECASNMACLRLYRDTSGVSILTSHNYSRLPVKSIPWMGELAVVVSVPVLKKHVSANAMKLVRIEDHLASLGIEFEPSDEDDYIRYLGGYLYEPEDSKDLKKVRDLVKSKGWDCCSFGWVYEEATGREKGDHSCEYCEEESESESESE